jgi:hypothetical protein
MSSFLFDYNSSSSSSTLPTNSSTHNSNNNNNNNHVTFALDNNKSREAVTLLQQPSQQLKSESIDDLHFFQSNNSNNINNNSSSSFSSSNSATQLNDDAFILPVKSQQEESIVSIDELFSNEAFLASSMIPVVNSTIGLPSSSIEKSKLVTNQVLFHNSLPSYYQQQRTSSSRPISFGSTTSSIVSTPSNQQKLIGKRSLSFLSEQDFPPISTTTAASSGKKQQTINYSTATTPTSSSEKKRSFSNPSALSSSAAVSSYLFQPKVITLAEREKCSCSLLSSLSCPDIIRSIETTLSEINSPSSSYERIHYEYNSLEYSFHIFYMKASLHCQMKIQLYLTESNDQQQQQKKIVTKDGNPIISSSSPFSPSSPTSKKISLIFMEIRYEDGDKTLFYDLYHQIKENLSELDEMKEQMTLFDLAKSKQQASTVSTTLPSVNSCSSLPTSAPTTCSISAALNQLVLSKSLQDLQQQFLSSSSITSTMKESSLGNFNKTLAKSTNYDFYSKNRHIFSQWIEGIVATGYPVIQLDSIKNLLDLCSSSCKNDEKLMKLLETYRIIETLLTLFKQQQSSDKSVGKRKSSVFAFMFSLFLLFLSFFLSCD